ncbi:hypothetical protein GYMLUDRAFT_42096 [Collybiopsis luxurians FD-317 M1]|uniref:DUF6534 domain-containing protein n=1 Tax=Collybiopsis luxurians FD-317 M1 TaxID=944289 RepID=A0A0D0D0U0_9AGAR|nr:hypothetical protein GYMLUDRAFT_42096 [Collybiopsis luxurians FD-317 M1]
MEITPIDNTFGAAFIGCEVAGVLLGVSLLQALFYYSQQSDTPVVRTLVGAVIVFDMVHQALISHTVYYYLVSNYGDPSTLSKVVWSLLAEVLFNGFGAFCVQSFLTWRIWKLSGTKIWITVLVILLVLAEFGCVVAFGIIALLRVKTFAELAAELKGLSITVNALAAASDVLIAGTLTLLLQGSKTGFARSDTMLNKLTLFAVNTGALTSLCAVASLISILAAPDTFIYISFFFCMGRLYTNSLLATLNARKMIRHAGDNVHTTTGPNLSFSFNSIAKSFTRPGSFISAKKQVPRTELDIKIDTVHEMRSQDYRGHHVSSKQEESRSEYEMAHSSLTNLSHVDNDSTISVPSQAHFEAV